MSERAQSPIHVATTRDGALTYLISTAPDTLPAVRSGDLVAAWEAAREAASGSEWGLPRVFRFLHADGSTLDLALTDEDACCWAEAVDHTTGMQTTYGLSLCLRLLALVDLLARAPWTGAFCRIGRAGAALDPALVRAAATAPLTSQAGFDETVFRARLSRLGPPSINLRLTATGAPA
jgi:hypothetical protein